MILYRVPPKASIDYDKVKDVMQVPASCCLSFTRVSAAECHWCLPFCCCCWRICTRDAYFIIVKDSFISSFTFRTPKYIHFHPNEMEIFTLCPWKRIRCNAISRFGKRNGFAPWNRPSHAPVAVNPNFLHWMQDTREPFPVVTAHPFFAVVPANRGPKFPRTALPCFRRKCRAQSR